MTGALLGGRFFFFTPGRYIRRIINSKLLYQIMPGVSSTSVSINMSSVNRWLNTALEIMGLSGLRRREIIGASLRHRVPSDNRIIPKRTNCRR